MELEGSKFLLAYWGWGNVRFELESKRLMANPDLKSELDMTSDEYMAAQGAERKAFVEAILLDWENVNINGESAPYSKELAMDVLQAYPGLWMELRSMASEQEQFARKVETALAKNS
jgi:hypothetical protein